MYEYIVKSELSLTQIYNIIMDYVSQHWHVFIRWICVKLLSNFDVCKINTSVVGTYGACVKPNISGTKQI